MKILRILNRFNVGGPTHNATYLTKFLAPEFETKLIAGKKLSSEASSEYQLIENQIDYIILENMNRTLNPFKDLKSFYEIRSIIKNFKPDIVHTHASKSGALGRFAAFSCKVPIVLHTFHGHVFHSYFGLIKTYFFIFIERFLAKKSSAIIAISELQKNELVNDFKICPEEKISVIPLGFDLEKFQINSEEKRKKFRKEFNINSEVCIGIVGRLTPIKNHEFFIKIIKQSLSQTSKSIKVFIIGDGEDKESIIDFSAINNLSISTHTKKNHNALIHFTSWRSDMDYVYAGLDIVALTSKNEGTPVTLIEAQASNKPIVSTNVGGVSDIVEDYKTGFLSEPDDEINFVKNLVRLIEDRELRESMGAAGYINVSDKFSYMRLVSDVKLLYKRLIHEKK